MARSTLTQSLRQSLTSAFDRYKLGGYSLLGVRQVSGVVVRSLS